MALDLGCVALHREELHFFTRGFGQMVQKTFPDLGVHGGVFDGRVGKDQGGRVDPLLGVGGRIGHQIAVGVFEAGVHGVGGQGGGDHGGGQGNATNSKQTNSKHMNSFARFEGISNGNQVL
jgi:hypothetical protein